MQIFPIWCNHNDNFNYVPPTEGDSNRRGGGHVAFGADPILIRIASCLLSIFWTSGGILTKLAQTHYLDEGQKLLDFGDLDLIFKVSRALWMSNFGQKQLVCTLSLEPNDRFWPNFMYCFIGIIKKFDVPPTTGTPTNGMGVMLLLMQILSSSA